MTELSDAAARAQLVEHYARQLNIAHEVLEAAIDEHAPTGEDLEDRDSARADIAALTAGVQRLGLDASAVQRMAGTLAAEREALAGLVALRLRELLDPEPGVDPDGRA